jgi:hypothetical protein
MVAVPGRCNDANVPVCRPRDRIEGVGLEELGRSCTDLLGVLNTLKMVPEVCRIICATANPTEVILAETETGRGILGVVDGFTPKGIEDETESKWRKDFLRQIGYKL